MRVLLALHHRLDPDQGASGATLGLGAALSALGCSVEYLGFDEAFGKPVSGVVSSLRFPWRVKSFLKRNASRFDVIDVSTGDNWVWAAMGRPGAKRRHALITRSHGLEHTVDRQYRQRARRGELQLSWKYPLYHGGFRLWEVRESLRRADHNVVGNPIDRDFAADVLHVDRNSISVVPNGIGDHFFNGATPVQPTPGTAELRIAAVCTWIPRKGIGTLVQAAALLHVQKIDFRLSIFGTQKDEACVLGDFPPEVRKHVTVIPKFGNLELPALLAGHHVLLSLSMAEGFSLGLVEGMASGLAPVATPVGMVLKGGANGIVVPIDDPVAVRDALLHLHSDRGGLCRMRCEAMKSSLEYRWNAVAQKTIDIYDAVLSGRPVPS